jgi:hypothetical protein
MEVHDPLCDSVWAKVDEQMERTAHLIRLLPEERLDWIPPIAGAWTLGMLLGHLLDCMAGICAVLAAAEPEQLAHFSALRDLPVNHRCTAEEALGRIAAYRDHIREGFRALTDADLSRRIPTVFVPAGEPLLTLLLGNLEHLVNHKHRLFVYLKMLEVPVGSGDLYRFRG